MEVYPGLVEYYANQVHLQALLLLGVVDCGCLGKNTFVGGHLFLCLWMVAGFFPVFWEGKFEKSLNL